MNGAEQMMYGHYDNNRHYFAAAADIGIGYEQALGTKNNIRLQPYIQLPLKGIGVGQLQLMGAGVRVAIIHQAH